MFEDLLKNINQSLKGTPFGLMGETLASGAVGQDPVTGEIPEGLSIIEGLSKSFFDIEPEKPKAHEAIDSLMQKNKIYASGLSQEDLLNLAMGSVGGPGAGGGKVLRNLLLAMKGKIKGGKMIPSQPFRHGSVMGESNPSKLNILLNRLKDNPNVGGNINRVILENIKKHKPK